MGVVPVINTKGRFVLRAPFVALPEVIYEVIAIRTLADIYADGQDVYKRYYVPVGLIDGRSEPGGTIFDLQAEISQSPLIITLKGTDSSLIHIPTTYIIESPKTADVNYSRVVVSFDLGNLPDTVSLDSAISNVNSVIAGELGVTSKANLHVYSCPTQPTLEQHSLLEAARLGSVKATDNIYTQLQRYKKLSEDLDSKVKVLISIMRENNLLETI